METVEESRPIVTSVRSSHSSSAASSESHSHRGRIKEKNKTNKNNQAWTSAGSSSRSSVPFCTVGFCIRFKVNPLLILSDMIPYPKKIIVSLNPLLNLALRCLSEKRDTTQALLLTPQNRTKKNGEGEKTARIERKGPTIIPHPPACRKEQLVARQRATILSLGAPSSSFLYNVSE